MKACACTFAAKILAPKQFGAKFDEYVPLNALVVVVVCLFYFDAHNSTYKYNFKEARTILNYTEATLPNIKLNK